MKALCPSFYLFVSQSVCHLYNSLTNLSIFTKFGRPKSLVLGQKKKKKKKKKSSYLINVHFLPICYVVKIFEEKILKQKEKKEKSGWRQQSHALESTVHI